VSHSYDETYEVYSETNRRAVKQHQCSACAEPIPAGHRYYDIRIVFDGVVRVKRCLRCQAIHEHLRTKAPGETWPAERLDCGESYEEDWGECPPEIEALAFKSGADLQPKPTGRRVMEYRRVALVTAGIREALGSVSEQLPEPSPPKTCRSRRRSPGDGELPLLDLRRRHPGALGLL